MSAYHHTEVIDFVGQDYLNSVEVAIETGTLYFSRKSNVSLLLFG